MNRTRVSGLLLSLLGAAVGCGDDDFVCTLDVCGTGCVNLNADPLNCGQCFNECGTNEACMAGTCTPTELVCDAPTSACGTECVDLSTSVDHCGSCDKACGTFDECVDGNCAGPLVVVRTVELSKGDLLRDSFVVDDDLDVHPLGNTAAAAFFERVVDQAVMPDGHVLLVAAEETEGVFELWLSSPLGGALTKLSGPLAANGQVLPGVAFSADSSRVLYRTDENGVIELYTVALAAPGTAVKVNGTLGSGSTVSRVFALSPNGDRALYISDEETPGLDELFLVDLATPGTTTKLNTALGANGDVWDFVVKPDGSGLVYRADEVGNFDPMLNYVDLAVPGTVNPIVNSIIASTFDTGDDYQLTTDGTAVIYRATASAFDESLYIASLAGPTFDSTLLAENVDSSNGAIRGPIAVAADAVYFRKDVGFAVPRLFKVALATPNTIERMVDEATLGIGVDHVAVSPDGKHLVFGAGGDGGENGLFTPGTQQFDGPIGFARELHHIDLTAALPVTPTRIVTTSDGSVEGDFFVKNDGRVVLRGDLAATGAPDTFLGHPATPDTVLKIGPVLDLATIQANAVRQLRRF